MIVDHILEEHQTFAGGVELGQDMVLDPTKAEHKITQFDGFAVAQSCTTGVFVKSG